MKLEQFPTVREYVTSMMMVSQELEDLGKEVDDELLAALLLQGLTAEFQPMRLSLENSNVSLTTDYVKTKLFQMEDNYTASSSASQPTSALLTNKHKEKKEALQAYAMGMTTTPQPGDWIIDSGASTHMTNYKAWFKGSLKKTPKALRVERAYIPEEVSVPQGLESDTTEDNQTQEVEQGTHEETSPPPVPEPESTVEDQEDNVEFEDCESDVTVDEQPQEVGSLNGVH
uniref:Uncharacterized protein n=1 Tax=Heliothis virescens TaxID=7102 RepID=A0A2A4JXG9_HELVI